MVVQRLGLGFQGVDHLGTITTTPPVRRASTSTPTTWTSTTLWPSAHADRSAAAAPWRPTWCRRWAARAQCAGSTKTEQILRGRTESRCSSQNYTTTKQVVRRPHAVFKCVQNVRETGQIKGERDCPHCLRCLGFHYSKPKGEPVSGERYN